MIFWAYPLYMEQNEIGVPKVSWKIQFVSLEQTDEYRDYTQLERVLLGDTVTVIFPEMNVNATARVVRVDYDPVTGRYNSITLGSVRSNMARSFVQQGHRGTLNHRQHGQNCGNDRPWLVRVLQGHL